MGASPRARKALPRLVGMRNQRTVATCCRASRKTAGMVPEKTDTLPLSRLHSGNVSLFRESPTGQTSRRGQHVATNRLAVPARRENGTVTEAIDGLDELAGPDL